MLRPGAPKESRAERRKRIVAEIREASSSSVREIELRDAAVDAGKVASQPDDCLDDVRPYMGRVDNAMTGLDSKDAIEVTHRVLVESAAAERAQVLTAGEYARKRFAS